MDNWPRFVADAQRRAHEKATLAAIQKSRQAVIAVSASAGASGSGAQLAMAIEGKPAAGPVEEILQDLGLAHSGGAKPEAAAPKPAATDKPVPSARQPDSPPTDQKSASVSGAEGSPEAISTPYGDAVQSEDPSAVAARAKVANGATLYRIGTMGQSHAAEAQF